MNARPFTRRILPPLVALAAVSLLLAGGVQAAPPRHCISATIPWTFVLPDGATHPAGSLTLCMSHLHNPVTGLHAARVDGHAVGQFISRLGRGEDTGEGEPVMVFEHSAQGTYRLVGYALPHGDGLETFRFYDPRAESAQRLLARAPLLPPDAPPGTVLLASVMGSR